MRRMLIVKGGLYCQHKSDLCCDRVRMLEASVAEWSEECIQIYPGQQVQLRSVSRQFFLFARHPAVSQNCTRC